MNANRLINMVINRVLGPLLAKGKDPAEMTPAEREQARKAREASKQMRKSMRITRRMGRF